MNEQEIISKRIELLKQLEKIAIDKNMTIQEISEKSGLIESNITRIFAGKFSPTLDNFLKIKKAILDEL